ncbi:MAG: hypothetical protein LQ341_006957 [Variospora aurantia]|nr:MAG: hypothetical protein LQ341_006957 [Variospora aurantia]
MLPLRDPEKMLPLQDLEKMLDSSVPETRSKKSHWDKSIDLPAPETSHSSKETLSHLSPTNTRGVHPQEDSAGGPRSEKPRSSQPSQSFLHRSQAYLSAEVSTAHADILFLWCCFISGLVDSTIYNAYGTFVSMQTGNTIFLGLGGATPDSTSKPYGWAKSLISIAFFCLGCLTFSQLTRFFGKLRRVTVAGSFLSQTLIILIAAAVVQGGSVDGSLGTITDDIDWWTAMPIALLSFQSAGQIVGSRAVNLSELPTVVLTSMLHDIFTDEKLLAKANVKRNRRVVAFFSILIGAISGGFIGEGTQRMQIPLWIAGGVKLGITLAWVLWPEKQTSAV